MIGHIISRWNGKRGLRKRHDTRGRNIEGRDDAIVAMCGELRLLSRGDRSSQFDFPPLSHVDRRTTTIDTQGVGAKPRNNRRRTVEQL